jgi:hypothetical protein
MMAGISMITAPYPDPALLRLLECWLPLAQELNALLGWGADAATLESLIVCAAPALKLALTVDSARAILMVYHASMGTST